MGIVRSVQITSSNGDVVKPASSNGCSRSFEETRLAPNCLYSERLPAYIGATSIRHNPGIESQPPIAIVYGSSLLGSVRLVVR